MEATVRRSPALTLIALTLACGKPDGGPDGSGDDTGEAVFELVVDCTEDAAAFADLEVLPTDMPTVLEVRWTSTTPTRGGIAYAVDAGEQFEPALSDAVSTEHSWLVRGLPENHEVLLRAVDLEGNCSAELIEETGDLPADLPLLTHSGGKSADNGFVLTPIVRTAGNYLTVIDSRGRFTWALPLQPIPYRLEASVDPERMITIHAASDASSRGIISWYDWTGKLVDQMEVMGIHTDFAQAPDGSIYALSWDLRELGEGEGARKILGDRIMRIDGQTHEVSQVWTVWDLEGPDLSKTYPTDQYAADDTVEDYSHANGLSVDAENGALLVSIAEFQAVASIDITTGEANWVLGGSASTLDGGGTSSANDAVANPHSIFRRPDGDIVVFNRGSLGVSDDCSRATVIDIDEANATFEIVDTLQTDECYGVYFLGQARPIGDEGRTLVSWTTSGRIDQFDADGEVVWTVTSELGAGMAYADHRLDLY